MKFKDLFEAEDKMVKYVPLAKKWLEQKFPQKTYGYKFEYNPKLDVPDMKEYNAYIDGKGFIIRGRAFDTNSNGTKDTVIFRIDSVEAEDEEEAF